MSGCILCGFDKALSPWDDLRHPGFVRCSDKSGCQARQINKLLGTTPSVTAPRPADFVDDAMPPPRRRRTVAIDFDGVIHRHSAPWTRPDEINDGPVPGAFEFIDRVLEEFDVVIFSARAADARAVNAIQKWLAESWRASGRNDNRFLRVPVTNKKVHAFIYIDDRGWRFEGTFPTMDEIRAFESWTKRIT